MSAGGRAHIIVVGSVNADLVVRAVRAAGPGAVLLSQEVPEAAVLAGSRAAQGPIVLNPAPVRRLPDELAALGPILTPNAGEARELTGEREPEAAARALAARTGAAVLVTLGGREGMPRRDEVHA